MQAAASEQTAQLRAARRLRLLFLLTEQTPHLRSVPRLQSTSNADDVIRIRIVFVVIVSECVRSVQRKASTAAFDRVVVAGRMTPTDVARVVPVTKSWTDSNVSVRVNLENQQGVTEDVKI